jgi:hypothetical protein
MYYYTNEHTPEKAFFELSMQKRRTAMAFYGIF